MAILFNDFFLLGMKLIIGNKGFFLFEIEQITILDPYSSLDHFFARFWYIYPKNLSIIDDRTKSMEKGRMSMPS